MNNAPEVFIERSNENRIKCSKRKVSQPLAIWHQQETKLHDLLCENHHITKYIGNPPKSCVSHWSMEYTPASNAGIQFHNFIETNNRYDMSRKIWIHVCGDSNAYIFWESLVLLFQKIFMQTRDSVIQFWKFIRSQQDSHQVKSGIVHEPRLEYTHNNVRVTMFTFMPTCVDRFRDNNRTIHEVGLRPYEMPDYVAFMPIGLWDVQARSYTNCSLYVSQLLACIFTALPTTRHIALIEGFPRHKVNGDHNGPYRTYRSILGLYSHVAHLMPLLAESQLLILDQAHMFQAMQNKCDDGRHYHIDVVLQAVNVFLNIMLLTASDFVKIQKRTSTFMRNLWKNYVQSV